MAELSDVTKCLKPGCLGEVKFRLTRSDSKQIASLFSCAGHTDLFHELVLAVKYGTWERAVIERIQKAGDMPDFLVRALEIHIQQQRQKGHAP